MDFEDCEGFSLHNDIYSCHFESMDFQNTNLIRFYYFPFRFSYQYISKRRLSNLDLIVMKHYISFLIAFLMWLDLMLEMQLCNGAATVSDLEL